MAQRRLVRAVAVGSVVLLAAAACANDKSGDTGGTDSNMGNAIGEKFTDQGALAGMRGTTPLTKLGDDFTKRLKEINPNLKDLNYAGESYDAAVIVALAAETARSAKGSDLAKYIN